MDIEQQGLVPKYKIAHADGTELDPAFEAFVLRLDDAGDPTHVAACRKAILTYAMTIQRHLPALAVDIFNRWGPELPAGWQHHYFKRREATEFLIDKAMAEVCEGREIWLLTENSRTARDLEVALRTKLAEKLNRGELATTMRTLVRVESATANTLYSVTSHRLQYLGAILIDNPSRIEFAIREGDPRQMLNKRLFMMPVSPEMKLISVETVGW